jgi:2'-5' RNA ligase
MTLNTEIHYLSVEYFVAITPPEKYGESIIKFQKMWPGNTLPDFAEPHITVKSQAGLSEDEIWMNSMKAVCDSFPRFSLKMKGIKSFGRSVVYLGIESDGINELHRRIVESISPDPEMGRRYYELDLYQPHLTLGSKEYGMSEMDLSEMMELANEYFRDFQPFIVDSIGIFKLIGNKYRKIREMNLIKTSFI